MADTPILQLHSLRKTYGALVVTNDVDLTVHRGERHALIGPNGAGKTTLFNLITGRTPLTAGRIELDGTDITRLREETRAQRGIGRTFQHSELFTSLDPVANVVMALRRRGGARIPLISSPRKESALQAEARDLLDRVGLDPHSTDTVGALAHGQRRQLEVAMALAQQPKVLLFDEPTAGMSASETEQFREVFASLPPDLAVVLIEHDLEVVFSLSSTITVLETGTVIASGTPSEISASAKVREAYLGADMEGVFG